jgi:hypothetical protein
MARHRASRKSRLGGRPAVLRYKQSCADGPFERDPGHVLAKRPPAGLIASRSCHRLQHVFNRHFRGKCPRRPTAHKFGSRPGQSPPARNARLQLRVAKAWSISASERVVGDQRLDGNVFQRDVFLGSTQGGGGVALGSTSTCCHS